MIRNLPWLSVSSAIQCTVGGSRKDLWWIWNQLPDQIEYIIHPKSKRLLDIFQKLSGDFHDLLYPLWVPIWVAGQVKLNIAILTKIKSSNEWAATCTSYISEIVHGDFRISWADYEVQAERCSKEEEEDGPLFLVLWLQNVKTDYKNSCPANVLPVNFGLVLALIWKTKWPP